MRLPLFLFFACLGLVAADRPNIIVILADDQGFGDAGFQGNPILKTPHLDALAASGVRFTDFLASPTCSPSRAALMTGRHEFRSGVTHTIEGRNILRAGVPTMAEAFANSGYRTGIFGKWHLGGAGFGPTQQGWKTAHETQGHTQSTVAGRAAPQRTAEFLTDRAVEFIGERRTQPFLLQVSHYAVHIPLSTTPELEKKFSAKSPQSGYPSNPLYAGLLAELDASVGRIVAAVDAAGLIDLVKAHLGAIAQLRHACGHWA